MKVIKQADSYIILDEFLDAREFALMQQYTQKSDYARNPRWIKPWDLSEQMPWQTGETVFTQGKQMPADDPRKAYPTGTAIDLLFDRLLGTKFVRQSFPDHYVTARSYLHPQGSGLDWHDDEGRFAGAYAYYTHPRWHASWGGELLLIEDDIGRAGLPDKEEMVDGKVETVTATWNVLHKDDLSEILIDGASSTEFIFPRPNRIVIMKGGLWHKITPVKSNAPFARSAIAGFFLSPEEQTPFWR